LFIFICFFIFFIFYITFFIFVFFAIIFFIALHLPNGPKYLRKLKAEGSGPSEEQRKKTTTELYYYTRSSNGEKEVTHYKGPEAYDATGLFAAEAAIAIVRNDKSILRRGVATTASALGDEYLSRLTKTGLVNFE